MFMFAKAAFRAIVRKIRRSFFMSQSELINSNYLVTTGMVTKDLSLIEEGLKKGGQVRNHHLSKAIRCRRIDILKLLLSYGADDINGFDEGWFNPPLCIAAVEKDDSYYKILLAYGANKKIKGNSGKTPEFFRKLADKRPVF